MRVTIVEGSAPRHVHHAMVLAAPAAARGQTRLRTGRNERHQRPEPVQENEANTHDATHGAPFTPKSNRNQTRHILCFYQTPSAFLCGTSKLAERIIAESLVNGRPVPNVAIAFHFSASERVSAPS
jgi:DNA-binding LacI/PurR family transcriptional regulator